MHMTENLSEQRIAIAGFGLMGGSLAMALRPHVGKITAIDRSLPTLQLALKQDLVDSIDTTITGGLKTDLLVLAAPIRVITNMIKQLPVILPSGCAVIDLGSTKRSIVREMDALPQAYDALGGHPMCGREVSGLGAARADLYAGRTFVLCRSRRTSTSLERLVLSLVEAIGARPIFMAADSHDRLVSASSHLPYAVSAALLELVSNAAEADERIWQVSASGLNDTTRLAGSNPEIMLDILLTNREFVLERLRDYESRLSALGDLLEANDEQALQEWLVDVHSRYQAYRSAGRCSDSEHLNKG
jgi:prephenate dehydrogenase